MGIETIYIVIAAVYGVCVLTGAIVVFVLTLKNRGTVKEAVSAVKDFVDTARGTSMVKMNVDNTSNNETTETVENVANTVSTAAKVMAVSTPVISVEQAEKMLDTMSDEEVKQIFNKLFERFIK